LGSEKLQAYIEASIGLRMFRRKRLTDAAELIASLPEAGIRLQPADDFEKPKTAHGAPAQERIRCQRQPQIDVAGAAGQRLSWITEAGRQHADHDVGRAIQHKLFTDDTGAAAQARLPERMRQDYHI
jgi:hypothetical protein